MRFNPRAKQGIGKCRTNSDIGDSRVFLIVYIRTTGVNTVSRQETVGGNVNIGSWKPKPVAAVLAGDDCTFKRVGTT